MQITTDTFPTIRIRSNSKDEGINNKTALISKSFIGSRTNTLFTPKKKGCLLSSNSLNSTDKQNGFLLEVLFHGLNFNAKRIKLFRSKYYVDVHKSEIFICEELRANTYKSRVHKRRLIFFSFNNQLLHQIEKLIKQFKLPNAYTGKGLFSRTDSYSVKKGKKR